jgi:hypothetical protein
MYLLPHFQEYTGHTRILTDGYIPFPGKTAVLPDLIQNGFCPGPGFRFPELLHPRFQILRKQTVCFDTQPLYCFRYLRGIDFSHNKFPF